MASLPSVIMIGDCGTGKSTAVERMSGVGNLASDSATAATKHQRRLTARNGAFCIVDTPGQNALKDRLADNIEVAMALNQGPVSLLLCTTKADVRLESVVEQVEKYVERFIDFSDIICIMVTHMDVGGHQWTQEECRRALKDQYEITKVVFTGKATDGDELVQRVRAECVTIPRDFSIDSENFLQYFRLGAKKMSIIKAIKASVDKYKKDVKTFQDQLNRWPEQKRADQVFQFNTFMTNEIASEQEALASKFNWDFASPVDNVSVEQQCGYVAHMASQMRAELFAVRTVLAAYHAEAGVSVLRKCPHAGCGIVWGKWEGCEGATTCGNRPSMAKEYRNGVFIGFTFVRNGGLQVSETPGVRAQESSKTGRGRGCGGTITWSAMEPVTSGPEWTMADINGHNTSAGIVVSNVPSLTRKGQVSFDQLYTDALQKARGYSDRARLIAGGA